jgi:hypothetical protein
MSDTVRYGRAMRLVDITPDMARQWLATIAPITPDTGRVRRYSTMMRDGTWQLMEMPIVLRNGRLLSSWNRLHAIIAADMTVPMYVSDDQCPR